MLVRRSLVVVSCLIQDTVEQVQRSKEMQSEKPTLGIIVGNRGFFPDELCKTGRETILQVFEQEGITPVIMDTDIEPYKRRKLH